MSLQTVMTSLATRVAALVPPEGQLALRRVYDTPPQVPPTTADCPCAIVFMRKPPQVKLNTFGVEAQAAEITVQFIFCPVGQGVFEENYRAAWEYAEPLLDLLWAHSSQPDDDRQWSWPGQATTPVQLPEQWGGEKYFGMDFTLATTRTRAVTLG